MTHRGSRRLPSGWTATGAGLSRKLRHVATGWRVEHCGHPTALWPWAVYDPGGVLHTSGRACDLGTAFRTRDEAIAHVHHHLEAAA